MKLPFIYVVDEASKEALERKGLALLKYDAANLIWVFLNPDEDNDDIGVDVPHVLSGTLLFN